jgi:cytokinesis protein
LFDDLLERKNVPEKDRPGMSAGYSIQKKWALVHNDRLLEWQTARKATQSTSNNTHRASLAPSLMASSSGGDTSSRADQQGAAALMAASGGMRVLRGKTETPEWYLQKILNQTITPADVGSLTVALRTYEMAWVKSFIELQGLSVLSNVLANITRLPQPRKDQDTKLELELLKCLKWLLNVKVR